MTTSTTLLVLDLAGVFAFALNGGLVAIRTTRVDIVGVITLGMVTALGGGILRDVLLEDLPPATFSDWRYLAVASGAGLLAFLMSSRLARLTTVVVALDAAGLAFFAVTGSIKSLEFGVGSTQAIILGVLTGVGGGTLRDVLLGKVPSVLQSGLYAIPALIGAGLTVAWLAGRARGPDAGGARCGGVFRRADGRRPLRPQRAVASRRRGLARPRRHGPQCRSLGRPRQP